MYAYVVTYRNGFKNCIERDYGIVKGPLYSNAMQNLEDYYGIYNIISVEKLYEAEDVISPMEFADIRDESLKN